MVEALAIALAIESDGSLQAQLRKLARASDGRPVARLLIFLPLGGNGLLGLKGGPGIMVHAILVNAPYGIVTTLSIAALSGLGASSVWSG